MDDLKSNTGVENRLHTRSDMCREFFPRSSFKFAVQICCVFLWILSCVPSQFPVFRDWKWLFLTGICYVRVDLSLIRRVVTWNFTTWTIVWWFRSFCHLSEWCPWDTAIVMYIIWQLRTLHGDANDSTSWHIPSWMRSSNITTVLP